MKRGLVKITHEEKCHETNSEYGDIGSEFAVW